MSQPLNQGQTAAANDFFQFLFTDEKEMKITGPGGVGKTRLMSAMIDDIMPRYHSSCALMGIEPLYEDVQMTATTNKAAEVLAIATQRPTSTVQSFLALKPMEDYQTGAVKLRKTDRWKVHEKKILFVDEYSMTDSALDRLIHEGTHQSKIVYVGDHCQLSPVMETSSPIDRRQMRTAHLTEQMRATIPELQALHVQLRHQVEHNEFYPIEIKPGVIDHLSDAEMQTVVDQTFLSQQHDSKILAYTNTRVNEFNDHIRGVRNLPEYFTVGEPLVNNAAIRIGKTQLSVEQEVQIAELAPTNSKVEVDFDGTSIEVCYATLSLRSGGYVERVPIPVDRDHFTALVRYYQRNKNWNRYFFLKQTFPDLRPMDASTVYKSQGSTYDSVFIDLGNISTCHNANQAARMLYVAASRAKSRIYLYGQLADKYGGLVF